LKQNILKSLKFISFFLVGVFIFWMVYKDVNLSQLKEILLHEVNYFWIVVSLLLGLFSHISRTIRWNMMIEPLGHKPRLINTFLAVMIGYLMNLALPRMGEISRCGVLSRYEKISFTKLVGTVVQERLIDVLMLLLLLAVVVFTQFGKMVKFLENNPDVKGKLMSVLTSPYLFVGLALLVLLIWISRHKIRGSSVMRKFFELLSKFGEGFKTIRNMKRKGAFIFHSFLIWFLYYAMFYCVFFSFGFTSHLSPLAALTAFVLGSFGMVAPVQGGIGAWHFMVMEGLALYGVDRADGKVFALVAHESTTLMLIVVGLISLLVLPWVNEGKVVRASLIPEEEQVELS
jgi:hypothetical protein